VSTIRSAPLSIRALLAVAVVAAAASVAACDAEEVGAAAVVGDERYTISELQSDVEAIADLPDSPVDLRGENVAEAQTNLIGMNIASALYDRMAAQEGVEVTEAQIDQFIDEWMAAQVPDGNIEPVLAQMYMTPDSLRDAVRTQLLIGELGAVYGNDEAAFGEAFVSASDAAGVEINPRYGEWDGTQLVPASGSVSVPLDGVGQAPTAP
jgi:peptidyl-prolyl cis-trans isomerase SurA